MDSSPGTPPPEASSPHHTEVPRQEHRSGCDIWSWVFAAGILAILFAAAFGNGGYPVENAKRTDSRVLGKGISDAITQFYGDYHRLPVPLKFTPASPGIDTDTSSDSGLIRILLGKEPDGPAKQNTRNINYLEGMKNAKRGTGAKANRWLGGIVFEEPNFSATDGWGNVFRIRLAAEYTGAIANPNLDEVGDGRPTLQISNIIWSPGKDEKEDTWEDNIKSWD